MGGDGTFAEVAKGILASGRAGEVRLAMLPTGTANDQGKSFGLDAGEADLPRNVRVIAEGHEARLDAGHLVARDAGGALVRDDWFFDSAGWGISPRVLSLRNEDRKLIGDIPARARRVARPARLRRRAPAHLPRQLRRRRQVRRARHRRRRHPPSGAA